EAERTGTIKQGVRAMSAIWQTTVPWCSVIVRNCFGVAGAAHKNGGGSPTRGAGGRGGGGPGPPGGGAAGPPRARAAPRRCARSPGQAAGDRGAPEQAALSLPLLRDLLDRGDRGPARHAALAVRVCRARRAAPSARAVHPHDAAVSHHAEPANGAWIGRPLK